MTIIGNFKLTVDGSYNGEISTLTLHRKVRLVPTDATGKNAPDLRVFAGPAEIGVAWQKASRSGEAYFALRLDDPSFAAPIWANLVESRQETASSTCCGIVPPGPKRRHKPPRRPASAGRSHRVA